MARKTKVKALDLKPGMKIKVGKKIATVVENKVIEVPLTRLVKTAVLAYRFEAEEDGDDDTVNRDRHMNANEKVEVLPEKFSWGSVTSFLSKNWKTPKKKDEKPVLPHFIIKEKVTTETF